MSHIYGHAWSSTNDECAVDGEGTLTAVAKTWATGLDGVSGEQIATGLHTCVDEGSAWPPALPEFKKFCLGNMKNEFGLDYVPECYRHESRPDRILESDPGKQRRKDAAKVGIAAMRAAMKTG